MKSPVLHEILADKDTALDLEQSILASLSGPDSGIPMELLSPPPSRDPSPRRLRAKSKSPVRWRLMRYINDAIRNLMDRKEPGIYGEHTSIMHQCVSGAYLGSDSACSPRSTPRSLRPSSGLQPLPHHRDAKIRG
jgi:hypothetical protein